MKKNNIISSVCKILRKKAERAKKNRDKRSKQVLLNAHRKLLNKQKLLRERKRKFISTHRTLWSRLVTTAQYACFHDVTAAISVLAVVELLIHHEPFRKTGSLVVDTSLKYQKEMIFRYRAKKPRKFKEHTQEIQSALAHALFLLDDARLESSMRAYFPREILGVFQRGSPGS